MPSTLPTPLAAALGLVPATLDGVRALPGRVVQLPILAVSSALTKLDATRRGYDDLAERGERLVARLRGVSFDEVEDAVEDSLQGTPVAGLYDAVEDAAEDAVEGAGRALRSVTGTASQAAQTVADTAERTVSGTSEADQTHARAAAAVAAAEARVREAAADVAEAAEDVEEAGGNAGEAEKAAEQALAAVKPGGKGRPTPKATEPAAPRADSAAAPAAVSAADRITSGGTVLDHDDLPLADYDHMTLGSLRGRLRSLSVEQLGQLRTYEKAHADRLPVVTMLDNRIAKLQSDPSATPTGNVDAPGVPELQPSQIGQGGSKVQPATGGPALNPPSQGVPTNPAQPR